MNDITNLPFGALTEIVGRVIASNGTATIREIHEHLREVRLPRSKQTVYSTVCLLKKKRMVKAYQGERRTKIYTLTNKGINDLYILEKVRKKVQ